MLKKYWQSILAPLGVMLLLTALVGISTFRVTTKWDEAGQNLVRRMIQSQFLTTLYDEFETISDAYQTGNTEEAKHRWQEVVQKVNSIKTQNDHIISVPTDLQKFLKEPNNYKQVDQVMRRQYFNQTLADVAETFQQLQRESQKNTLLITGVMVILGLFLTLFTARHLMNLIRQLAESRDLNISIQESERRRIAQDLHDDVIQTLIVLKRNYDPKTVDRLIQSIRGICLNLKPQVLEEFGLRAGLEILLDDIQDRHPNLSTSVQWEPKTFEAIPKHFDLPIFRMIQELLNNISRHAHASKASLTLVYDPEESPYLSISVRDNGKGFDMTKRQTNQMGLTGLIERVNLLNGKCRIQSQGNLEGTLVQILLPIPHKEKLS